MDELIEIINKKGEYFLYPYLFRLTEEKISVTYPEDYGIKTIIFPSIDYFEDWILNESCLEFCEYCGIVTNEYGIEDQEEEIPVCRNCFETLLQEKYPQGWEIRSDGFVFVGEHDIAPEIFCSSKDIFQEPGWVLDFKDEIDQQEESDDE